ncbi:MAG: hypothetical protein U1E14_02600 [Geminicoccaceae bacterium]
MKRLALMFGMAIVVGGASAAHAGSMVSSELLDLATAQLATSTPSGDLPRVARDRSEATIGFGFTPRNPLSLLFGDGEGAETLAPIRVTLSAVSDPSVGQRLASLGGAPDQGDVAPDSAGALEVGGALQWSDWTLGSGYTRAPLFGGEADLMSASVGYGKLQASLAYGQSERQSDQLDVLMFSTNLDALSWLSVESDIAVGSPPESDREPMAAGRVGIRLNF